MKIARGMPGMRLVAGAVLALPVAGLLLVSYDAAQYYEIFHCLLRAKMHGELDGKRLTDSQRRLDRLLKSFSILSTTIMKDSAQPP